MRTGSRLALQGHASPLVFTGSSPVGDMQLSRTMQDIAMWMQAQRLCSGHCPQQGSLVGLLLVTCTTMLMKLIMRAKADIDDIEQNEDINRNSNVGIVRIRLVGP